MSGIYIHIPFCKQACHYCDFHFSTSLKLKDELIDCLIREIDLQKYYLPSNILETIYFGGGTPSILKAEDLNRILDHVYDTFEIIPNPEITCESNPDDLSEQKLKELTKIGFNRLSIGLQSFDDEILKSFNRAHDSSMGLQCIERSKAHGISNLSIDLIFGAPNQTNEQLQKDLMIIEKLDIPHVSIYGMTIEDNTVFGKRYQKGQLIPLDDEIAAQQFEIIMKELQRMGYTQYEISNFARQGYKSKHNSSYWKSTSYLGIGPSAHSFDGTSRQFNVSNNAHYIRSLRQDRIPFEKEELSHEDQINERILIQLRTINGLDIRSLIDEFQYDILQVKRTELATLENQKFIIIDNQNLKLTDNGKLLADSVIEKLII
ncbi:radical SAM family heme chaperone HemW [Reichenbachiella versicolor]|uniref:radical SAM family heme chaperone HemW n=1 Tax=Reichenbachiella versicolor TaxID=1821036 RepID=UPI000D6E3D8F|nr:radical SAM family heme chaperone HemW [Reichenbachiella versicolor]